VLSQACLLLHHPPPPIHFPACALPPPPQVICSATRKTTRKCPVTGEKRVVRVPVWNWVVANVSLMAVGSRWDSHWQTGHTGHPRTRATADRYS